jgi:hypothetical protein
MTSFTKDPGDTLDYSVAWTLETGENIASSAWAVTGLDDALTIGTGGYAPTISTDTATVWLSGGTVDTAYTVTNTITTNSSPARIRERSFRIVCESQ